MDSPLGLRLHQPLSLTRAKNFFSADTRDAKEHRQRQEDNGCKDPKKLLALHRMAPKRIARREEMDHRATPTGATAAPAQGDE